MKEITNPNSVVWLPRKRKLIFFFLFQFFPRAKREQIEYNNKIKKKKPRCFQKKKNIGLCLCTRERESKRIEWRIASESGLVFLGRERERERERETDFLSFESEE